jgi:hypothetical protein
MTAVPRKTPGTKKVAAAAPAVTATSGTETTSGADNSRARTSRW